MKRWPIPAETMTAVTFIIKVCIGFLNFLQDERDAKKGIRIFTSFLFLG